MNQKVIYINGSYLSISKQQEVFGDEYTIYNTFHIGEKKPKKGFFYWGKYLFYNFYINLFSSHRKNSEIQIFNSIIGCFFVSPKKKNILIIHSYDIGIRSDYVAQHSNSKMKSIIIYSLEYIFGNYIRRKIQQFDTVFVSTHDRLEFIQKNIRKDSIFLPNIVEISGYKQKNIQEIKHVLCPERVDSNKGLEVRKELLLMIQKFYPKTQFLLLERGNELESFKKWVDERELNVIWLPYMSENELHKTIYKSDLILGIFTNGALSITNMESMLLQTPIITYDKWESIKIEIGYIHEYAQKMIYDTNFRYKEVEKNYEYILKNHSTDSYSQIIKIAL